METRREWASSKALAVLEEMAAVLEECAAVLSVLGAEANLNLDELSKIIEVAQDEVDRAFGAASLLNSNAALSASWTYALSRPRAVFARHTEAVRSGAPRVQPAIPTLRFPELQSMFEALSEPRQSRGSAVVAPQCSAIAKSTGRRCSKSVVSTGAGAYLNHCYSHLGPDERMRYLLDQAQLAETEERQQAAFGDKLYEVGWRVADEWFNRHRVRLEEGT